MNIYKELSLRVSLLILWLLLVNFVEMQLIGDIDVNYFFTIYLNIGIFIIFVICTLFENKLTKYIMLSAISIASIASSYVTPGNYYSAWMIILVFLLSVYWEMNTVIVKFYMVLYFIISTWGEYNMYNSIVPVINILMVWIVMVPFTIKLFKKIVEIKVKHEIQFKSKENERFLKEIKEDLSVIKSGVSNGNK